MGEILQTIFYFLTKPGRRPKYYTVLYSFFDIKINYLGLHNSQLPILAILARLGNVARCQLGARAKKNTINASEAKNRFGQLLDFARNHPMTIEKNGRPVAVMISAEEFERLEAFKDAWWASEAQRALKEGMLGQKESENLLAGLLNAKD